MSRGDDIRKYAQEIANRLGEVKPGTETTTAELAKKFLKNVRIDNELLWELNNELSTAAEEAGYVLDRSGYDMMLTGLPFTIPFAVKRVK